MARINTTALIVAAGNGVRAETALPKQFARLGGKTVLAHSVEALRSHPEIDDVVVVIGPGQEALLAETGLNARFVIGGSTRRDSVLAGLATVAGERVLIHDAARPLLPPQVIDRLLAALDDHEGAVPVLPVADTLARGSDGLLGEGVTRTGVFRVQTPQAFALSAIRKAHARWPEHAEATDDASVAQAAELRVAVVEGHPLLEKLTYPSDFAAAEARLGGTLVSRSATGFDVHRLEAGEELWLGGVLIPHHLGLSGHSEIGRAHV